MYIRTDEAGAFSFESAASVRIAVVAAVLVPDGRWQAVESFVEKRNAGLGVEELKDGLEDGERAQVLRFMADQGIKVVAVATDSSIFTAGNQRQWRTKQLNVLDAAVVRSERVKKDPVVKARTERIQRRISQDRHVALPDFLQYSVLTPWLLAHALSSANYSYGHFTRSEEGGWAIDIVMDDKRGAAPGKAGELMADSLEAIYAGSESTSLYVPADWPADHPFRTVNRDPETGTLTVRHLLRRGVRSDVSTNDPGLQLADVAAGVIFARCATAMRVRSRFGDCSLTSWCRRPRAFASRCGRGPRTRSRMGGRTATSASSVEDGRLRLRLPRSPHLDLWRAGVPRQGIRTVWRVDTVALGSSAGAWSGSAR